MKKKLDKKITCGNNSTEIFSSSESSEFRYCKIFTSYKGASEELIPLLQDIQKEMGYLSQEAMLETAYFLGIPESRVYAAASFYAQFRFKPRGKNHILVCRGTACHVRGAQRIIEEIENVLGIKEGETTPDLEYTLDTVACIGCCGLAPTLMINKEVKAGMTPEKVRKLFKKRNSQGKTV